MCVHLKRDDIVILLILHIKASIYTLFVNVCEHNEHGKRDKQPNNRLTVVNCLNNPSC